VTATAPADANNLIKLGDFKAARVMVVSGRSAQGTSKTSAVTGMKYLSYGGTSTSFPFGRKNETDTQQAGFDAIRAQLQAADAFANATYSLKQEVV
jgi:hypothetical protein